MSATRDDDATVDALRDLVASPGFAIFAAFADREWGDAATVARMRAEPDRDQRDRLLDARVLVEQLLAWPAAELARIADAARVPADLVTRRRA